MPHTISRFSLMIAKKYLLQEEEAAISTSSFLSFLLILFIYLERLLLADQIYDVPLYIRHDLLMNRHS